MLREGWAEAGERGSRWATASLLRSAGAKRRGVGTASLPSDTWPAAALPPGQGDPGHLLLHASPGAAEAPYAASRFALFCCAPGCRRPQSLRYVSLRAAPGRVTVPSAAPARCTGGSSQVSPLGEGACFQLLSREVCCPVAGGDLSLAGVLTLPGTWGSVFRDTEDFNFPLLWMVMRPASLSHVLNVEQRWLAENLLVKWRECEKRAGRGWEHLDVGAFQGAAEVSCRQRGQQWDVLSEPSCKRQHFPSAENDLTRPHLCFHCSLPFKDAPGIRAEVPGDQDLVIPVQAVQGTDTSLFPFAASQEGRAAAEAQGHFVTLGVNDFFRR